MYTLIEPYKETLLYSICPSCGKPDGTINHLINSDITTSWYCSHCGNRYKLKFKDGKVFVEKSDDFVVNTLVLLRYKDLGIIVKGKTFYPEAPENDEYYYNTHTCPINYLREVEEVIDLSTEEQDPHGIFRHVATIPYSNKITSEIIRKLIKGSKKGKSEE